ncbi:MAG: hypothetical protein SPF53_02720, partial [Helicobacter trogontum]|nr:hypothetical protein [Helicobacter trogontum]
EQLSISANNTEQLFESDYNINAGNQITHQISDTQIIAKGDSVIIKAGSVEVVIDSNGLVVKGGEVKSEWEYALYNLYNRRYRLIYYS